MVGISRANDGAITERTLEFPDPKGPCLSVLEGEHQELFVATLMEDSRRERLLHFDGSGWKPVATGGAGSGLRGWPDRDGGQWVAEVANGSFHLTTGLGEKIGRQRELSGRLLSVLYEGNGRFWVATSLGLARFAPPVWGVPSGLRGRPGRATSILETRDGSLYIMQGKELLRRAGTRWLVYPLPREYYSDEQPVGDLAELADGRVVLGNGPGLLSFDPAKAEFQPIRHPSGLRVTVLGPGRNGTVWIMTTPDYRSFRVERFDGHNYSLQYDAGSQWGETFPRAACEAADGTVYLVPVPQGIGVLKERRYTTLGKKDGYTGTIPVSVAEVGPGRLWFGDRNQIVEYSGRRWSTVRENLQTVRSILKSRDGSIWLGSGGGLSHLQNGNWIDIADEEGLPGGATYKVLEDKAGTIWATTTAGIATNDNGADLEAPRTVLDQRLNPERVPPSGDARFVFSGIDRWKVTPSNRLLYSWRLDGGRWSTAAAADAAEFHHLARGQTHRMEVRAVDRNGNVDPAPASLTFTVLLPWYMELGFMAACFVAVFALVAASALTFVRQRQLARLVERRTAALAARNNQFQSLAAAVPGVLYSFRLAPDGVFSVPYVSPKFLEMSGIPPEDLVHNAAPLFAILHPEDAPRVRASIAASATTMALWNEEFRVSRPGYPDTWIEGRSVPSHGPDGSILWHGFMADVTERKRLEETARREAEREMGLLKTLVAEAPYGLAMLDRRLRPVQVSERWLKDSGLARDQVIGHNLYELFPNVGPSWMEACRRGLAGDVVSGTDDRFTRPNGEERWFDWTVCPWGDAGEESGGVIVYTEDTTERKRAEEAARETEVRYSDLFRHMSEALIYCRMIYRDGAPCDFEYVATNESYLRLPKSTGVVGQRVSEVYPGIQESDPELFQFYGRVASTGKPDHTELHLHATGEWYSVSSYSPRPGYFVGIFQIITSRKQAEQELRRSRAMLHSVVSSALDGVVAIDDRGLVVLWNPAAERIFGYTQEEAVGQSLHSLIAPPSMHQEFSQGFELMLSSGQGQFLGRTVELTAIRKGGVEFPVELSVAPVHMSDSFHAVGVVRDISARKHAELERERLQSQFLQAQKMESVGRLAGGIAHDFNNLLTVINGYSQMTAELMPPSSPAQATIAEIARAGERAAGLVRQLLVFSRKEVARLEVVDLNSIISDMKKSVLYLVGEDVRIVTHLSEQRLPVEADRHQMGQILMNLIVNARDAMPAGGTITITTRAIQAGDAESLSAGLHDGNRSLCLSVSDTGTGMDENTRQHLFDPFFTTKPAGKGTGLGLSVVHGIVTSCGGKIKVDTALNTGTTFSIYLPLVAAVPAEVAVEPKKEMGGMETVLLTEDEPEVRHYVSAVLSHFNYNVVACQDADEALDVLKRQHVDLLLTDVVMPRMSGRDLALQAKTLNPNLRVLFMSGYPGDALEGLGELVGTHTFIQKPFSPKDLAAKVRELLAKPARVERILVTDDEPAIRELLRLILEPAGFAVTEAASIAQARAAIVADHPVLLLTDLTLPGEDGVAAVQQFRKDFPDLRVIAMSGGSGLSDLEGMGAAGPHSMIRKPIHAPTLVSEIRRVLALGSKPHGTEGGA
ncbi:PAS domain S-box protein [uncultured Paludibaculum sp.]|uniref:PAS domain S-box protein n=1 Tax=uncultured Paludibaculum sp. TaxID=1765020 RepID=UPI002AAB4DE0|nr:PAS domain S-box protein [uncultured Paludibaculum sp.]